MNALTPIPNPAAAPDVAAGAAQSSPHGLCRANAQAVGLHSYAAVIRRASPALMSQAYHSFEDFMADMQMRVTAVGGAWHDDTLDLSDELAAVEDALAALKSRIEQRANI